MNVLTQIFFSNAYAQAQGMADKPAFWQSLMPILIIFVIFYFLMIRPQKKTYGSGASFFSIT